MSKWMQHWPRPDLSILNRALPLAAAAWLSFTVAALFNVENAYWAAMPVWVISQATRNLLFGRALYRIAGSLLGALLGFGILQLPLPVPLQLCLAAGVIAAGAGACHLLPGVRSYAALMLAVTVAVVVIPAVLNAEATLQLATERAFCTLIGVIVTTLVLSCWTPPADRMAFYGSVRQVAIDMLSLADMAIREPAESAKAMQKILADLSQMESRVPAMSAGSREGHRREEHVTAVITATLELQAAVSALSILAREGANVPAGLGGFAQQAARHLGSVATTPEARQILAGASDVHSTLPAVQQFLDAIRDMVASGHMLFATETAGPGAAAVRSASAPIEPERDWESARESALLSGVLALLATNILYLSEWPSAVPMAMAVCIFSIVLGSLPSPHVVAPILMKGVCAGVVAALAYRIWFQPFADTAGMLVLSVLPFIVIGAMARVYPKTALPAIDANMCFMLASQAGRAPVGTDVVVIEGSMMLLGTALVALGFLLLPRRPSRRAGQATEMLRRGIQRLCERCPTPVERHEWQSSAKRAVLRLTGYHVQKRRFDDRLSAGLLAVLCLGNAILDLHRLAAQGDIHAAHALRLLVRFKDDPTSLATHFQDLITGMPAQPLEDALALVLETNEQSCRLLESLRHGWKIA